MLWSNLCGRAAAACALGVELFESVSAVNRCETLSFATCRFFRIQWLCGCCSAASQAAQSIGDSRRAPATPTRIT